MNQEKIDSVYRNIIKQCNEKGWTPNQKIDHIEWIVAEGTFFTKVAVWNDDKMEEQTGACSIERIIFDHAFAKIMWGENFVEILKEIVSRNFHDRIEYLETFCSNEDIITEV